MKIEKKTALHKNGSSALLNIALEKEGKKKKKKSYYNTGYSYLVTHPSTIPAQQDLRREHRRAVEKAITQRDIDQPTAVSDHFNLPGHSLNNLELIPLELINSNRDAIRKAREAFLIYKGKTLEPSGMNRRDEI